MNDLYLYYTIIIVFAEFECAGTLQLIDKIVIVNLIVNYSPLMHAKL